MLYLITFFSDEIAETFVENLVIFISAVGKNRFKNPNENIAFLKKASRAPYRLDQASYAGINIAIAFSLNTIRFLEKELKEVDKAILNTVSGLAKYAGLYWKRSQSRKFRKEDKKMSKHSNKYLRYYLIEATACCVRMEFPFIKEFYDLKFKEASKHQHKRALVLSPRKLVRLIFRLLRKINIKFR